jgi:hypothetical protein
MQEGQLKKLRDKNELKIPYNTNYGPQETEQISQLLKDKRAVDHENLKSILMEQMKN